MGQFAQPLPQDDLPFFLSLRITAMTAITIAATISKVMIVPTFAPSHSSISCPPFVSASFCCG